VSEQESTVSTIGAGGKFEINNQLVNNDNLFDVINRTIDRLITGLLSSLQHYCGGWDASTTYTQEATVQFGSSPSRLPGASLNGRCTRCPLTYCRLIHFQGRRMLELRPTIFGTPPVEEVGTSRSRNQPSRRQIDSSLETRLVSIQTLSCFTLFNKLLVLPSIRLSILVLRHKRTLLMTF
jgi:hypothetical protein